MTRSWRSKASQSTQSDLDALLDLAINAAQRFLLEHGEFHPFGMVMAVSGDPHLLAVEPDDGDAESANIIDRIIQVAQQQVDSRAFSLTTNVRLQDVECDAIQVELEHRSGQAIAVQLPYLLSEDGEGAQFADMRAFAGRKIVWG